MKKLLILIIFVLGIGGIYCFYPHKVEHAILLESNEKFSNIYLKGKKVKINISNINYPVATVFNYKFNRFKAYGVTIVKAYTDRVLVKGEKNYEIESQGNISLATNTFFYKFNKSVLEPCTNTDLIPGKNNVKSFLDSSGYLTTFIISPIDYATTRVGISTNNFSSLYHEKIHLMSSSKLKLYSLVKKTSEEIPENTLIEITSTSKGMYTTIDNKSNIYLDRVYLKGDNIKILNIKRGFPEYIPEYSGILEFSFSTKGICITNELNIEDYLTKVVPSEMPISGGIESLKAQAVVSRTSAISDILSNKFESLGFYVDDSPRNQVYNNSLPNDLTNNAINSTKNLIMTFDNLPIDAKFFSTSCGTGVRHEDVWYTSDGLSSPKTYFRTVNFVSTTLRTLPLEEEDWLKFYKNTSIVSIDSLSPYYRWNIKVSAKELSKLLNKTVTNLYTTNKDYMVITKNDAQVYTLPKLGELKNLQVMKRSSGGNVMNLNLVFENATVLIKGDSTLGTALNFGKDYTGTDISLSRLNSTAIDNPSTLPSKFFSIEKSGDIYTIYGGGYGHGVGMSQYGALNLSKNDWDFKKILNIYYKDITYFKMN